MTLKGIKVIELGQFVTGPLTSMILGDLGCEVLKIEPVKSGDRARNYPPFLNNESVFFLTYNRNKKSLTLDIKQQKGREMLTRLIGKFDIFIENLRPGSMEKMGLGYDQLKEINPGIIYASCSGFGQEGPMHQRAAKDIIIQAMSGVMSLTGMPDGPPVRVGYATGDIGGAMYATIAILAALYEREKSGVGQFIDISLLDCQLAFCQFPINIYLSNGDVTQREGYRHGFITPFQIFRAKDGYISIVVTDDWWRKFCWKIGHEELIDDERFKSNALRNGNWKLLEDILNGIFSEKNINEWVSLLDEIGVPCGPVMTVDKAIENEHVRFRKMVKEVTHNKIGRHRLVSSPIKFSRSSVIRESSAPLLGEHTEEVLKEYLELRSEDIETLRKEEII